MVLSWSIVEAILKRWNVVLQVGKRILNSAVRRNNTKGKICFRISSDGKSTIPSNLVKDESVAGFFMGCNNAVMVSVTGLLEHWCKICYD